MLDMRSYRGPNSTNLQPTSSHDTAFLGEQQVAWLKQALDDSEAVWKVIAADMPIGLVVPDYADGNNPHTSGGTAPRWFEAIANADPGATQGTRARNR